MRFAFTGAARILAKASILTCARAQNRARGGVSFASAHVTDRKRAPFSQEFVFNAIHYEQYRYHIANTKRYWVQMAKCREMGRCI